MTGRKNSQAFHNRHTSESSNLTSNEKKKRRTEMAVQVEKKNLFKKIQSLKAHLECCRAFRDQDLKLYRGRFEKCVNLSHRVKDLEEKKKNFAEVAAFIDFIACAREFVLDFEVLHYVEYPAEFVSTVKNIASTFSDLPMIHGEHCRNLFWILLQKEALFSKHLDHLREYLNSSYDKYWTFSCNMQQLFDLFPIAPRTNSSLTFGSMSRRKVLKYTRWLLPGPRTALRLLYKSYKKASTPSQTSESSNETSGKGQTSKSSNKTSDEEKKCKSKMVQVEEEVIFEQIRFLFREDPYEQIRSLEAEIERFRALSDLDLKSFRRAIKESVDLSFRVEDLEEETKNLVEVAALIDFIACAREFVLDFEQLHEMELPVDFVSAVQIDVPSFLDWPIAITRGEHCQKFLWILLRGEERFSEHLKQLRNYLDRSNDRYLPFSLRMQELFGLFSMAPRTNASLKFGCMSRRQVKKYTSRLPFGSQYSLRLIHKSYKKASRSDE